MQREADISPHPNPPPKWGRGLKAKFPFLVWEAIKYKFPLPFWEGARGRAIKNSPTLALPRNRGGDKI